VYELLSVKIGIFFEVELLTDFCIPEDGDGLLDLDLVEICWLGVLGHLRIEV
jgi:hypothetical protein